MKQEFAEEELIEAEDNEKETKTLFYLIRPGTNIVALNKDGTPIVCEEYAIDATSDYVERWMGDVEAITVSKYFERFKKPLMALTAKVSREIQDESEVITKKKIKPKR